MNIFGKKLLQNKGFSMVELLIAVGILSIVGVSLVAFVRQSSNTYNRTTAETDVQEEAQLTANAITDRVIDCETQLKFYDGHETIDSTTGTISYESFQVGYKKAGDTNVTTLNDAKILQMINTNSKVVSIIFFDKANKVIYYNEAEWDSDPSVNNWKPFDPEAAEVLANNVEDFSVDTSKLTSDKILEFDITYARRARSYKGNYQVHMRNEVAEGNTATPGAGTPGTSIIQVNVSPDAHIEYKRQPLGLTMPATTFTASASGTNVPGNMEYDWSMNTTPDIAGVEIDTNVGGVPSDNACVLKQYVNPDPSAPSITEPTTRSFRLIATSREDNTKSGYATIYVDKVVSVFVNPTASMHYNEEGKPVTGKNSSITFNAAVEKWNAASETVTWHLYKDVADASGNFSGNWQVPNSTSEAVMSGVAGKNATVLLKSSINDSFRFKVEAVSNFDNAVKGEFIFYISNTVQTSNISFLRGVNMDLHSYFMANPTAIAADVTSIISVDKIEITGVPDYPGDFHSFIQFDNNYVMYVDFEAYHDGDLNRKKRFYEELEIELKVYYTTPAGSSSRTTRIKLPAVKVVKVEPAANYIVIRKGASRDIKVSTLGYNVVKESQMSIFLGNVKVTGGSGTNRFLTGRMLTSENGASILGTRNKAVTEAKFRLSAISSERWYPTGPITMKVAIDDYYVVSNASTDSFVSYDVYVANVEGSTTFIPGADSSSFPASSITAGSNWKQVSVPVYTNSNPGTNQTLKFRYRYNGTSSYQNGYEMQYNGNNYIYDVTYKYWRLNR